MAIREQEWAGKIAEGLNTVDVSVSNVPVTHSVKIPEIQSLWSPIAAPLSQEYGSRAIVRDAVARGIPPKDYSEQT